MSDPLPPQSLTQAHLLMLSIAWCPLENMLLWSTLLKNYKNGIYLHIFLGSSIAGLMITAGIFMIIYLGPSAILIYFLHETVGFALLLCMPLILFSGALCKIQQQSSSTDPKRVYIGNWGHTLFGWFIIFMAKIPLYAARTLRGNYPILLGMMLPDVLSHFMFLFVKFYLLKKMQNVSVPAKLQNLSLRVIKSEKDLQFYSQKYFIFADYVYSIESVLGSHPGGWKIIEKIQCREVDRFIYGMEPLEVFNHVSRISHTAKSIKLAGEPLAKLCHISIYSGMDELNEVSIESMSCHDSNLKIYTVYLRSLKRGFDYRGYSELSQIGKYYAVTILNKKTRLYTMVNFLQPKNIEILREIIGKRGFMVKKIEVGKVQAHDHTEMIELKPSGLKQSLNSERRVIPLLIKKYNDGRFTPLFLNPNFNGSVLLSQSRGLGLSLTQAQKGRIIMMAGGTGLYPFSDTIDLVYKEHLVNSNHYLAKKVKDLDPLVGENPFKNLEFTLYIAVNEVEELHPITLFQCDELARSGRMKCYAKIKKNEEKSLTQMYPNITVISNRFQEVISKEANDGDPIFYLCGPTRFTKSLVEKFEELYIGSNKYRVI